MKISRKTFLRSLGLVVIVILVIFFVKHSFYKNKLFQYKYWIADTEITDYEFLENGEAISVSWAAKKKVTDELRFESLFFGHSLRRVYAERKRNEI